jgi:hypothetical protein
MATTSTQHGSSLTSRLDEAGEQRFLFNDAFLESGCNTALIEYDEVFNVDDTPWTYWTNYAIGVVAILFFILIISTPQSQSAPAPKSTILDLPSGGEVEAEVAANTVSRSRCTASMLTCLHMRFFVLGYLLWSALGYTLAGVGHQLVLQKYMWQGEVIRRVSYSLVVLGTACLWGESLLFFQRNNTLVSNKRKVWMLIWLVANSIILAVIATTGSLMLAGVWLLLANVVSMIRSVMNYFATDATLVGSKAKAACLIKALAMLLSAVGLLVQVSLAGTCGGPGYERCFEDCPLPNAGSFNHNAVFHLFMVASFAAYGIAEVIAPSSDMLA